MKTRLALINRILSLFQDSLRLRDRGRVRPPPQQQHQLLPGRGHRPQPAERSTQARGRRDLLLRLLPHPGKGPALRGAPAPDPDELPGRGRRPAAPDHDAGDEDGDDADLADVTVGRGRGQAGVGGAKGPGAEGVGELLLLRLQHDPGQDGKEKLRGGEQAQGDREAELSN